MANKQDAEAGFAAAPGSVPMSPKVFREGRWQNCDGTALTYDELKEVCAILEGELNSEWRYAHDEIEAACGGETALAVREAVMRRRAAILSELANNVNNSRSI